MRTWYLEERDVCRRLGVRLLDIQLAAQNLPSPEKVKILLAAYRNGPYPMLIHCAAGADRTGLAAALYLIDRKGLSVKEAQRKCLNLAHGHMAFGRTRAMDTFLGLLERNKKSFSAWMDEEYPAIHRFESQKGLGEKLVEPLRADE